jgi:hypothetical protein
MNQLELFPPKQCDICKKEVGMTRNPYLYDGVRDTGLNVFMCFQCKRERNIIGQLEWLKKHQQTLEKFQHQKS